MGWEWGEGTELAELATMHPIVTVCYQVCVCVSLNGRLSVERLHEPIGPGHLSPPHRGLINDSFSGALGGGEEGGKGGQRGWLTDERRAFTTGAWRVTCRLH